MWRSKSRRRSRVGGGDVIKDGVGCCCFCFVAFMLLFPCVVFEFVVFFFSISNLILFCCRIVVGRGSNIQWYMNPMDNSNAKGTCTGAGGGSRGNQESTPIVEATPPTAPEEK